MPLLCNSPKPVIFPYFSQSTIWRSEAHLYREPFFKISPTLIAPLKAIVPYLFVLHRVAVNTFIYSLWSLPHHFRILPNSMNSPKVTMGKPLIKEFFMVTELVWFSNLSSLDIPALKIYLSLTFLQNDLWKSARRNSSGDVKKIIKTTIGPKVLHCIATQN